MPRSHSRVDRVADLIQQTLAHLIQREVKDPRFTSITITAVDVSPDLKNAIVFVTLLDETKAEETVRALNKAAGFFRSALAAAAELRITPKLQFRYDESISRAGRVSKLIDEALKKQSKEK